MNGHRHMAIVEVSELRQGDIISARTAEKLLDMKKEQLVVDFVDPKLDRDTQKVWVQFAVKVQDMTLTVRELFFPHLELLVHRKDFEPQWANGVMRKEIG